MQRLKSAFPLILFILAFLAIQSWPRIRLLIDPVATEGLQAQDVVMYATQWCPYCEKTRDFFERAGIPYTEYDIEQSQPARREYERLSGRGVPLIRVGNTVIQGYDTGAIREAIDRFREHNAP